MTARLTHLQALESEAIHVMREVAAELRAAGAAVQRRQGLDRAAAPRREGVPARALPVPADARRHRPQLPRGDRVPRPPRGRARRAADRRVGAGVDRRRAACARRPGRARRATACRRRRCSTRSSEHGFDAAFGGARRDEERARAKERIFSFRDDFGQLGSEEPAPRAVEHLQRAHPPRRARARVPDLQLDRARRLGVHRRGRARAAVDLLRPRARGVRARRDALRRLGARRADRRRGAVHDVGALPHGRRHERARARSSRPPRRSGSSSPRSRRRASPSAARRAPTTASPRPRWKTARARATSDGLGRSDLLRLATAGSVDDGKSTLIGRLLFDTKQILTDQLEQVEEASRRRGGKGDVDLSLLVDGLRAEREQGITIDVAYRYFATPRRTFIIADTPGHVQYTRNMVTGASTADLALILVDARNGVVEQSAATRSSRRCSASRTSSSASTRWTSSTSTRRSSTRSCATSPTSRAGSRSATSPSSRSRARTATTSSTAPSGCRGTAARRCSTTSSTCTSPRPQPRRRALPRAVGHPADHDSRLPRLRRPGRRRHPAPRRRGPGAAVRRALADRRIDTFDGPVDEAFAPMSVTLRARGRDRRLARRHALRRRTTRRRSSAKSRRRSAG